MCDHKDFVADVTVTRVEDSISVTGFSADIHVKCAVCNQRFRFLGVPSGLDPARPMVSADGCELRAPLVPSVAKIIRLQ